MQANTSKSFSQAQMLSLYGALRACDSAVIRSGSGEGLFESVCKALVASGCVSFAWIGKVDGHEQQIWPQAQCARAEIDLMPTAHSDLRTWCQDAASRAIASNQVVQIGDIPKGDGVASQLPSPPTPVDWKSMLALPLRVGGRAVGVLCVYVDQVGVLDDVVGELLQQLASNISYALESFERDLQRDQAQVALSESEARYSSVFANNCIPMLVIKPEDDSIVDANDRAVKFYGWDRDTLIGMHIGDINVLTPQQVREEMARAANSKRNYCEFVHRRSNNELCAVEVSTNLFEVLGRTYLISAIHDVTERRELEARVHGSQMLMQRFVDHLPGPAFIKDSSLRLQMANRQLGRVLGRDPVDLIGKTAYELFPKEFADFVTGLDREVLAEGGNHVFEESFGDRHNETSMFVIEDDAGRRLLGGLSFDVTERYRAHQRSAALLELNTLGNELDETAFMARALAQVERLTHSAMGFLHLVSDDHRTLELVTWGRGAQRVDDCAEGRQIAEELASLWGDAVRTRQAILLEDLAVYASHRGLANSFSAVQRVACVPVQEGGRVRMLLGVCNKAAAYDAFDTETMQLLGNDLWRIVCRNRVEIVLQQRVEELVALNQKLSSIQLQLLQSEKMASIGQLASGVAHEINNPIGFVKSNLTSLSTYIDNLVDVLHAYEEVQTAQEATDTAAFGQVNRIKREVDYNFLIDDLKQLIAESADGVQRVNQIVQDLKNFSHTADGRREWADLNAGIDSTINVVWNQLKYKVNLKREFGDLPPVRCIASQINQVVMNLLVNAGHAIAGQGHITVRTGVEGSSVWIEVEDDGSGISEENQHRIFEPFFTTKPVGQGTGLGLSISFGIVQRHHGAITMRSALGQGTTFRITLPVDAPMESKE